MERLKQALDKARAERQAGINVRGRIEVAQPLRHSDGVIRWQDIRPMETDRTYLLKHRVVAQSAGQDAAPYDLLRTRIMQLCRQHGWRRIAVISANPGTGKTTTMTNLSLSLARQNDLRIIALDFDLRRPSLARVLGQQVSGNMGAVINGKVSFSEHARRYGDNLLLGMNDGPVPHSAELLQGQATEKFLARVEADYAPDLMVFDMPPLRVSDDTVGFLAFVDCALIIAEAEQTPMTQVDITEKQVAEITNVAGVVLNKCNYTDGLYGVEQGYY